MRRARILASLAALGAAATITTPALAGAQETDPAAACRPQLEQMTQLDPHGATFTIPAGCPDGTTIRYSAFTVNEPCGDTPDGRHVCTLPDDWTVSWHYGLLDQTLLASGEAPATPGPRTMPLVDACELAPGALLQLDLDVTPPGGDTVNATHRYYQCAPPVLTAAQPRDIPTALPPVTDVTLPSAAPGDVPAPSATTAVTPTADTPAAGGDGSSPVPAAATPVVLDTARAALPDTGGRHLDGQGLAGLIVGAAGSLLVFVAWALRRQEAQEAGQ